jgi:hypothetical protein
MVLAWPLTTCLLVIGKYVPQWEFLAVLLGDQPVLSPRVAFYQRLAARDQDEAAGIVEKELASRPAEKVFDDLMIPALSMARQETAERRLSDEDLKFVVEAVREVADDVPDFKPLDTPLGPLEGRPRLLLVPAKDSIDQAGAELLAGLLDPTLWHTDVFPAAKLSSELLAQIETTGPAVVLIASVAPGGLTHTRYLTRRLRKQFPKLKLVVGRWGEEAGAGATEPLQAAGVDEVVTSLEASRTFLSAWRAVFAEGSVTPQSEGVKKAAPPAAAGTVSA